MSKDDQLLSQTISWLRFPMIAGVVLLHVDILLDVNTHPLFGTFQYVVTSGLGNLAVPTFFLVSGFLFFYNSGFSFAIYKKKLRRRFFSLIVPYLFWNLAFMAAVYVIQRCAPSLNNRMLLSDYSFLDFLNSFWNFSGTGWGTPILSFTWFLRDLILMVVCTPILYVFIRYTRGLFVLVLAICFVLGVHIGLIGFPRSWLFFSMGACLGIFKVNFAAILQKYAWVLLPFGLAFLILITSFSDKGVIYRLYVISGVVVILSAVSSLCAHSKCKQWSILAESSFFIYLFHGFYIANLCVLYNRHVPLNTFTGIMGYFVIVTVACAFAVCVYWVLRRFMPKFCSVITGGR